MPYTKNMFGAEPIILLVNKYCVQYKTIIYIYIISVHDRAQERRAHRVVSEGPINISWEHIFRKLVS